MGRGRGLTCVNGCMDTLTREGIEIIHSIRVSERKQNIFR